MRATRLFTVLAALVIGSGALVATPAEATVGDIGYQGASYDGAGTSAVTADKPESKLWFAQGSWFADMWSPTAAAHHIFRLDGTTHQWIDTGVGIDDRAGTQSDALYAGNRLYIASHRIAAANNRNLSGQPTRLYRYSFVGGRWQLDAGFPSTIHGYSSESLTMDIDGAGRMWSTWTQGGSVRVTATVGRADAPTISWMTPFVPAVPNTMVSADDISATVTFAGGRTMLVWSNQATSTMNYAIHDDLAPPTTWTGGVATSGPFRADDHINLKSLQSDARGRVFAAVKTSRNDAADSLPSDPLIQLLTFTPTDGAWSAVTASTVADSMTRPVLVLDDEHQRLHLFSTGPSVAGKVAFTGTIYEKVTSLDNPSFAPGEGTPVIRDAASADMNNATTTKQSVTSATGLVVLASNSTTLRYWHADIDLGPGAPAPVASFSTSARSGPAPLTVAFTDTSTQTPTSWAWDFGDGTTSTAQSPSHTYSTAGSYTARMTASNAAGSSAAAPVTITVSAPAPAPAPASVLYRVNAGGAAVAAPGTGWSPDTAASPSPYTNATASYSQAYTTTKAISLADPSVPAGTPMALFQSHRYDVSRAAHMLWHFPVAANRSYTVRLYFAESWSTRYTVGARVFNVLAEGSVAIDHLDVFAAAGKNTGLVRTVTVPVTDGSLDLDFAPVKDNPMVNAIEIVG